MGRQEHIVEEYLTQSEVFAALFNGYVFGGCQVIQPEGLIEMDSRQRLFLTDGTGKKNTFEVIKKQRDIVREFQLGESRVRLAVLGIEHQSEIDYSMALRTLAYDTLEYLKQAREIQRRHQKSKDVKGKEYIAGFAKDDHLIPTISLVFYTGQEKWDAAMELRGLCEESPYLDAMKPFMTSTPLNLIHVYDVKDTEKYSGSLKKVFDLLRYAEDGDAMLSFVKEHREEYSKLDEVTMRLLSELIHLDFTETNTEGKEDEDMCKALEDIRQMGRVEGRAEEEARIITNMYRKGFTLEQIADVTDKEVEEVRAIVEGREAALV